MSDVESDTTSIITAPEVQSGRSLSVEGSETMTRDQVELLKTTICKGATDDELKLFVHACKRTRLDPFMKQIHAVKRWDSKLGREVMSIQTGIDGYRITADRTGQYGGSDDYMFDDHRNQYQMIQASRPRPSTATVTIYKIISGVRCPFVATAGWEEYKQTRKDGALTPMWAKMPFLMLGKCAEALALRKAFPAELSGIYTNEEMGQADNNVLTETATTQTQRIESASQPPKVKKSPPKQSAPTEEKPAQTKQDPPQEQEWRREDALPCTVKMCSNKTSSTGKVRYGIKLNDPLTGEEFWSNTFDKHIWEAANEVKGSGRTVFAWINRRKYTNNSGEEAESMDIMHIELAETTGGEA